MDPRPYNYEFRRPRLSNPTYLSDNLYQSVSHFGPKMPVQSNSDKITNSYYQPAMPHNPARERANDLLTQRIKNIDPYTYELSQSKIENEMIDRKQTPIYENQFGNKQNQRELNREGQRNNDRETEWERERERQMQREREIRGKGNNEDQQGKRKYYEFQRGKNQEEQKTRDSEDRNRSHQRSFSQDLPHYNDSSFMSSYGSKLMRPMPGREQDRVYERQQKGFNIISCHPRGPATHRKFPRLTLEDRMIETGSYVFNPEY